MADERPPRSQSLIDSPSVPANRPSGADRSLSNPRATPRPIQTNRPQDGNTQNTESSATPSTRRPGPSRRTSSKLMPYRGATFSVDDAREEVDEDEQMRNARHASGSVRRNAQSTVRRRAGVQPARLPLIASRDSSEEDALPQAVRADTKGDGQPVSSGEEGTLKGDEDRVAEEEDDEGESSDAESFTLKDRQDAINETHPFGIRVWKPALYKKGRSVEKDADTDLHSVPGGSVSKWLWFFNFLWTVVFGWWLALVAATGALICYIFGMAPGCVEYGSVLWGLAKYIFYPFGKYVKLIQEEAYAEEDHGEGRTIGEYEQWQSGDLEEGRLFFGPVRSLVGRNRSQDDSDEEESTSLLGRDGRGSRRGQSSNGKKTRLLGRGKWNVGRIIYFIMFWAFLTPLFFLVSALCWLMVFTIPMARVQILLFSHMRRHPLALEFHADTTTFTHAPEDQPSLILLCTYRAVGIKYWKYTFDGQNIILLNLLGVVVFTIFDYFVLYGALGIRMWLTNTILVFLLALFSIIPLAYFIGQAVASISAQSTMGLGAAVNAFFSTIVEVFLYCVALKEGKSQLVEGSLIGSIFAGVLFLPGLSMCFGAIKRKTQRFNVKSAGVTSTMLLFATIGAFAPTLFYQIYGAHELNCHQCDPKDTPENRDCRKCFFTQVPAVHDPFYESKILPYCWFAAALLFLSYIIGLLFTLRTHAATIWNVEIEEKKAEQTPILHRPSHLPPIHKPSVTEYGTVSQAKQHATILPTSKDIKDSPLYKRVLGQSLRQAGLYSAQGDGTEPKSSVSAAQGDVSTPAETTESIKRNGLHFAGMSEEESQSLVRQMTEIAATAATVAARDASETVRKHSVSSKTSQAAQPKEPTDSATSVLGTSLSRVGTVEEHHDSTHEAEGGGHDAPNWGRLKSYIILLTATVAYAVIAEILVNTVDAVLENSDIDEKFLGITLFALVPNTTEFLNAISFAMNGNIALSMEIGSAYALQVCLLQIPALVFFSAIYGHWFIASKDIIDHTFTLLFPQWDMVTVILCVFLLSYMYGEGKSNYFKGSILILSYFVVIAGFYLIGFRDPSDMPGDGIHPPDNGGNDGTGTLRITGSWGALGGNNAIQAAAAARNF